MKIYLDDVRELPEAYVREGGWVVVRTAEACIELIEANYKDISVISFDHDLGDSSTLTGYDVATAIEKMVYFQNIKMIPEFRIHSANPVGRKNMQSCFDAIVRNSSGWGW